MAVVVVVCVACLAEGWLINGHGAGSLHGSFCPSTPPPQSKDSKGDTSHL